MSKVAPEDPQVSEAILGCIARADSYSRMAAKTEDDILRYQDSIRLNNLASVRELTFAMNLRLKAQGLGICFESRAHIFSSFGKAELVDQDLGLFPEPELGILYYNVCINDRKGQLLSRVEHLRKVCGSHDHIYKDFYEGADGQLSIVTRARYINDKLVVAVGEEKRDVTCVFFKVHPVAREIYNYLGIPYPKNIAC